MDILVVHVFEKRGPIEWEEALISIALLSAMSWKKYHGRIALYTNEEYLESLRKWGVDKIYDYIDTETLKTIPEGVDTSTFWAYGKIHVASKINEPFVLVDNDLWLEGPLEFRSDRDFIAYHFENFNENFENSYYINFDSMIPKKWIGRWDKELLVTNTALLWINNKHLIDKWVYFATEIAKYDSNPDIDSIKKMIFVEQRLLPMIAKELNLKYSTFIHQIYLSSSVHSNDGSEWDPHFKDWNQRDREVFSKIVHIWGLKKYFTESPEIRQLVFNKILHGFEKYTQDLDEYLPLLIYLHPNNPHKENII
jgi:hypothetical protein